MPSDGPVHSPQVDYRTIITVDPAKRGGKPTIRGTRITVYDVLSYLAAGMTHAGVLADFPTLTEQDILACLSYAADREQRTLLTAIPLSPRMPTLTISVC
jgi:uncharacterized protein (DUF433 family)